MNLKRYDRDYRGDLIPRAEGPLCLYSEVHDMSEALTAVCAERDNLIEECERLKRKAMAFDAIAQAWVENRFSLTIGADNEDGYVDIDSLEPSDTADDLLTAIEAALAAKETT